MTKRDKTRWRRARYLVFLARPAFYGVAIRCFSKQSDVVAKQLPILPPQSHSHRLFHVP